MTRAVLDSSVLVSALITRRDTPPGQVLRAWARGRFQLVVSEKLLGEVSEVLGRPKFSSYVTSDEVGEFLETLRTEAAFHPDPSRVETFTRDPDDDYLVALARSADATLVSSDADLFDIDLDYPRAVTPREFLEQLTA